jgi:tetratricopeptide (TPR) repeat protein
MFLPHQAPSVHHSPDTPSSQGSPSVAAQRREVWVVAGLCLAAVLPYVNALANGFVYDDEAQILQNPYVHSWHFLRPIFASNVWSFMGAAGSTNYYRPLMTFSYLLTWKLLGSVPIAFHIVNLAWHLAAVLLVYFCGKRIFGDGPSTAGRRIAALAAAIFALHPVHVEAVVWAAALPDLQVTVFCLLALLLYTEPRRYTASRRAGLVVVFALALLSKEPALMLAPLLVLYEFRPREASEESAGSSQLARLRRLAPILVLAGAYIALRSWLLGALAPVLQHGWVSWPETIFSAFALVAQYALLLVWPARLSAFHVFVKSTSVGDPRVLAGIAIVAACLAVAVWLWRRAWPVAFAILWTGFFLAPVLNARWMASNVLTERYLYLPSVGFCWLLGWAGVHAWDTLREGTRVSWSWRAFAVSAVAVALTTLAVVRVVTRNEDWSSSGKLFAQTLVTDPMATVIRNSVATGDYINGNFDQAESEYLRVLRERPDLAAAANGLGLVYLKEGRRSEAAEMFERAASLKPLWDEPYISEANLALADGDRIGVEAKYRRAIQLNPLSVRSRNPLGALLLSEGRAQEAAEQFKSSITADMNLQGALGLADALKKLGNAAGEEKILMRALAEYPESSELHFRLAELYAAQRRNTEAIKQYRAGLLTDPRNEAALAALTALSRAN